MDVKENVDLIFAEIDEAIKYAYDNDFSIGAAYGKLTTLYYLDLIPKDLHDEYVEKINAWRKNE